MVSRGAVAVYRRQRISVDARGLALWILAVLASAYRPLMGAGASWSRVLLGIVVAYTLNPLVTWLEASQHPSRRRHGPW